MRHNGLRLTFCIFIIFLIAAATAAPAGAASGGKGDKGRACDPLPPGDRPPPDVFSRVADAGTAADHPGAGYVVAYDQADNRVKPSGVTYVDRYVIYKMLTPAGCREMSVLRWNYDPQSSYVEVREVNIIRSGARIPVDVSLVHDLPAPQSWIYWSDRIKTLQLPRLEVGDGVEVKVFRKGFTYALLEGAGQDGSGSAVEAASGTAGQDVKPASKSAANDEESEPGDEKYIPPMPGEYFDIVLFAEDVPVIEKRYNLVLPADKRLHSEIYNGPLYSSTSYSDKTSEYSWWGFDLPAVTHERFQPDASDFTTKVVMATVKDWKTKSRWFFDVNKDQFEVTPGIKAKVDEILSDAGLTNSTEERKARALVHWVAQNIRYSGQTMGEGEGFTLHPGWMIFEQRSGVCKDIAGMLITMMRAAGLNSFAAMTMAGSRIEQVPADQFNHCVCALRLSSGKYQMYDPTWVPFNNNIWSLLEAEQDYLIGSPGGEELSRIAYSPPQDSPLKVTHDATLLDDGTLVGKIRLAGSGAVDSRLRGIVAYSRLEGMGSTFAALIAPVSERVEGIKFKYRDADDFSGDMWIEIEYRIPRFAVEVDGGYEFPSLVAGMLPANVRLFRAASVSKTDERKTDVFLYYTQEIDAVENIKLPSGYRIERSPDAATVEGTYASFSGRADSKGRNLTVTEKAEVKRRQIPPEYFDDLMKAVDGAKDWSRQTYRATKGGRR